VSRIVDDPAARAAPSSHTQLRRRARGSRWDGPASPLLGVLIALFLSLVTASVALIFHAVLRPVSAPWLPEFVNLVGSVDTRLQRWSFLMAATVFAAVLAVAVVLHPKTPRWLARTGTVFCVRLDQTLKLAAIARGLGLTGPSWLPRAAQWLCLAAALAIFASGQLKLSTYTGGTLLQVVAGDPHIYTIFGRAGEALAGRFAQDPSARDIPAYGFGPSAIYALGRHFRAVGSYHYAYQIARWSNLIAVIVLLWGLFRPQFTRLGVLASALMVVAAAFVAIPLLLPNSYGAYAANLSGLRYAPILMFIVGAALAKKGAAWVSIFILAIFAGLGVVYSIDFGIPSLIGYITFIGLEQGSILMRILRASLFLTGTVVVVALLGVIIQETLSVDLFGSVREVVTLAGNDFGGLLVGFNLLGLVIITLFVVTASALVYSSIDHALDNEQRFVAAIAVIGFFCYLYYLRRPWNGYFIYAYLALFVLRYWLGHTSDWATSERRAGAVVAIAATVLFTQQSYPSLALGLELERINRDNARTEPISILSGIRVGASFADTLSAQISALDRLGTPDSLVVTGFPYLMTTASKIASPPHDIVFEMTTTQGVDVFVASVLAGRPSRVFLEPTDTQAWGPELMHTVVARIENEISGSYKRDDSVSAWRVWNLQLQHPRPKGRLQIEGATP
jgi:hypothetical protein